MGKNIRRRRSQRPARTTILLVTNGGRTEKTYLDALKRRVPRKAELSVTTEWQDGKEPETILKNVSRSRGSLGEYDEEWIVVDHDGKDRRTFLNQCVQVKGTRVVGVVSVPCFEVWLNAHYAQVHRYHNQEEAQRHYRELIHLPSRESKSLPRNFPFDNASLAAQRCQLQGEARPEANTQSASPSTTMPHLLQRLGLIPPVIPPD